jgi:hypothetical protein
VDQQPVTTFHSPVLTTDIQPKVSNCKKEQALCYKFSVVGHSSYEPVREYMELHFLHVLELPNLILPSVLGGALKNVIVSLSQFHYFVLISDRANEFPVRKPLEWLWWKFTFT